MVPFSIIFVGEFCFTIYSLTEEFRVQRCQGNGKHDAPFPTVRGKRDPRKQSGCPLFALLLRTCTYPERTFRAQKRRRLYYLRPVGPRKARKH